MVATTAAVPLNAAVVDRARSLAGQVAQPVLDLAATCTTVAIERATLRLAGLCGADEDGTPWVNVLVDAVRDQVGLAHGVTRPVFHALASGQAATLGDLAAQAGVRAVSFSLPTTPSARRDADAAASAAVGVGVAYIDAQRRRREDLIASIGDAPRRPWVYLIVATGDIDEDVPQAVAAARAGADVIAVIRSTGQSLLDYVPDGATHEGFAGTFATQENFRIMRAALDDVSRDLGRYVRLTNYASGLCMPEIAVMAGLERLDMMLNDAMYGILFRDINPVRTFVDQHVARQIHARAGIIINTGEDNYLTTDDAVDAAHTVTVSQLLNEYLARAAGLHTWQLGLGHAFEIDPMRPESFRLELAHALLARTLFPEAPLKWMPPTKHMTGDIFFGALLDGFFTLAGAMTGQGILLVGMMTEAIATPWLSDRDTALQTVRYVLDAAGHLCEDFHPAPDGFIATRAATVLDEAVDLLTRIAADVAPGRRVAVEGGHLAVPQALLSAIGDGTFGLMSRPPERGRGLDGVALRANDYVNPLLDLLGGAAVSQVSGVVRPYGDTTGDGRIQVSFTVPVPAGRLADGAAVQLAQRMGLEAVQVVHSRAVGPQHTFVILYGTATHLIDLSQVVLAPQTPRLSDHDVDDALRRGLGRPMVVVGACLGADAHTVGIDAILNVKGFAGDKGLEHHREMHVHNLGAQVPLADLIATALEVDADALLISQVVSQKGTHLHTTRLVAAAVREAWPEPRRPVLVVGGPSFDEGAAADLGVDRIFGRGTSPADVASYLVHAVIERRGPR